MNELGEWLVRAREARGLTLEDAERDTRISRRYLQALETGDLDVIPAPVYARGFLRSYAQYLGLSPQEAMERYPRDDGPPGLSSVRRQPPPQQRAAPPPAEETVGQRGNRPTWRRPGPMPQRPAIGAGDPFRRGERPPPSHDLQEPLEPEFFEPEPDYGHPAAPPPPDEPTIGVDIGVPVPARRITDPAGQTRSMVVLAVAVVAIGVILLLAFAISRLGGNGAELGVAPGLDDTPGVNGGVVDPVDDGEVIAPPDDDEQPAQQNGAAAPSGIVPDVEGDTEERAVDAIRDAGLEPNIRYEATDAMPGIVLTQSPAPGTQRSPGDPVTIIVSEEP
jgi:cytoskeleton protein RodZ